MNQLEPATEMFYLLTMGTSAFGQALSLTIQTTWYTFIDKAFRGFEITAGIVGPPVLAEQTQKTAHKLIGGGDPTRWV